MVGIQSNPFSPFLERQDFLTRLYQRQTPSSFAVGAERQFLLLADAVRQFLDIFVDEAPAGVVAHHWFVDQRQTISAGMNLFAPSRGDGRQSANLGVSQRFGHLQNPSHITISSHIIPLFISHNLSHKRSESIGIARANLRRRTTKKPSHRDNPGRSEPSQD